MLDLKICTNFQILLVYIKYSNKQAPIYNLITNTYADFIYMYLHFY